MAQTRSPNTTLRQKPEGRPCGLNSLVPQWQVLQHPVILMIKPHIIDDDVHYLGLTYNFQAYILTPPLGTYQSHIM